MDIKCIYNDLKLNICTIKHMIKLNFNRKKYIFITTKYVFITNDYDLAWLPITIEKTIYRLFKYYGLKTFFCKNLHILGGGCYAETIPSP